MSVPRASSCAAALALTLAAGSAAGLSPKKGVGMWSFPGDDQALEAVQASWFYTWSPYAGFVPPAGVSFVPLIWGAADVTTADLDQAQTQGSILLGFNEPDLESQSNLSPAQALALWPQLVATGMRLGSPAPSHGAATDGGWLETFMQGAAQQQLEVDFICLHWYGGDFDTDSAVSELQTYLQQTHAAYQLPIWLTEFALTDYSSGTPVYPTVAQQSSFATAAVRMLEATPYVERYAWFSLPPCPAGGGNGGCGDGNTTPLSLDGGGLTAVGEAYAAAQSVDAGLLDGGMPDAGQVADSGAPEPDAGSGVMTSKPSSGCSSSSGPAAPLLLLCALGVALLRRFSGRWSR